MDLQAKAIHKDEETQSMLNAPVADPTGVSDEDRDFMKLVLQYIDEEKFDLYKPATIINQDLYAQMNEKAQGEVDIAAINMLNSLRQIADLHKAGFDETFQAQNLIHHLRVTKEQLEHDKGDLFII